MPTEMHLHHLTLQTGHSRRSTRDEVSDVALCATSDLLRQAIDAGSDGVHLPLEGPPEYWLRATPTGRCLLVTVMHGDDMPIVTIGVSARSRCGAAVWRGLLDADPRVYGALHGHAAVQPKGPWCAVRIEPGLALRPEAAAWLADLERCVAWSWITLSEDLPKRPGRPVGSGEGRTSRLEVRTTPERIEAVRQAAAEVGLPVAQWIDAAIDGALAEQHSQV